MCIEKREQAEKHLGMTKYTMSPKCQITKCRSAAAHVYLGTSVCEEHYKRLNDIKRINAE
jgi:hypothetical protein